MARKSRVQKRVLPEEPIVQWKAGVYARVSVSDSREHGESILNQLKLAQKALLSKPDISFVKNYVDDGYSGMHFNRPAFQSMLEDLKCGIINCVIVKDVSRIGRDYLGVCQLLQETFPSMGVRFISMRQASPKKAGGQRDRMAPLDEIIAKINEEFIGEFTDADRVIFDNLYEKLRNDDKVKRAVKTDDRHVYDRSIFPGIFDITAQLAYMESMDAYEQLFLDADKYKAIQRALADRLYRELHGEQ